MQITVTIKPEELKDFISEYLTSKGLGISSGGYEPSFHNLAVDTIVFNGTDTRTILDVTSIEAYITIT